jgi:hypothetical protein
MGCKRQYDYTGDIMKKNVASQLISAQMVSASDGSDQTTGTCNVAVEIDGVAGTGGTATHIANGKWEYAPIQADTNGDYLTFQFVISGAITHTVQVYPQFPQTVDNNVLAAGATGFAAIDTVVDAIKAVTDLLPNAGALSDLATILVDTGTDIPALIAALDVVVDRVEADTQDIQTQIGTAGANLTAINLPDQTMNITGSITGNLTGSVGSNLELGPSEVNAEVVDALNVDTYAEPGQGAPAATSSLAAKINYLYKAWRNKTEQTATTTSIYNDAGSTVDQKSTVSDNGTTATRGEIATGP